MFSGDLLSFFWEAGVLIMQAAPMKSAMKHKDLCINLLLNDVNHLKFGDAVFSEELEFVDFMTSMFLQEYNGAMTHTTA